jgi:DNA-binding transcriptional LysR family regulator
VPLWALMPPGRHRAPRVRAFLDFMADRMQPD